MKVTGFKLEIRTDDGKTVGIEYGEECDLELDVTQSREHLRGFRSLNPSEVGEFCPTGDTRLELKLKATNREQVAKALEFAAKRFDVQIVRP